jgi:hypothetical protein
MTRRSHNCRLSEVQAGLVSAYRFRTRDLTQSRGHLSNDTLTAMHVFKPRPR